MAKRLISLEESDYQKQRIYENSRVEHPVPNGIECPNCEKELVDSSPNITLYSDPPQKEIYCPNCNFRGFRVC